MACGCAGAYLHGCGRAQEAPLFERVRNTLEEIIERREKAPPVKRVRNTLTEILEQKKERIERRRAAEMKARRSGRVRSPKDTSTAAKRSSPCRLTSHWW